MKSIGIRWKFWTVLFSGLTAMAVVAAITLISPRAFAAYACPACFGQEETSSGIYVEATMPVRDRTRLARVIAQAREQVASFYGSFERRPLLLVCATAQCDRQLGGGGAKSVTFGASFIRISPAGIDVTILAHEFSHVELHSRLGLWKFLTGAVASWFDEGVAVIVADDARYLKPGGMSSPPSSRPTPVDETGLCTVGLSSSGSEFLLSRADCESAVGFPWVDK